MSEPDDSAGLNDRDLLRAHLSGDPDAFGTLFSRHRDRLWAVALRTTGDPDEAADALQDAMISAFRRAETYRGEAAVTTWLHRIVVNASLDRLRRRKVRTADPLPDDVEEYSGRGATPGSAVTGGVSGRDPADAAVAADRRRTVVSALEALPPEQRAALVLVDMEGYPVEEAARILDCAPGTVKSRCSRGRARLAPLLGELRDAGAAQSSRHGNRPPPARVPPADQTRGGGEPS